MISFFDIGCYIYHEMEGKINLFAKYQCTNSFKIQMSMNLILVSNNSLNDYYYIGYDSSLKE